MLVIGHRGAAAVAPENTVAGVLRAFADGADGVEVDVRRTAEGRLVCSHDPLAPGTEPAALADVLDAARGRGLVVVEVKNVPGEPDFDAPEERTARLLLDLLDGRGGGDQVTVSSFDWFAIDVVRDAGRWPTAFLTPPGVGFEAAVAYVVENGHRQCHPHYTDVLARPGALDLAREAGVEVVCWTVDDPADADALAALGMDGIITNDPALMRRR